MAVLIAVLGLAAPVNGQPSLVRVADFRAGWGDAGIGYTGTDLPETQDPGSVKLETPPDADPGSIRYQETPGWLFAIGKDRRGHRRIWRMERPLGTVHMQWADWGSPPSGFEEGVFIFSHGAVWMLGEHSGRPTLFYADIEHPSPQWTGTGRLPIEQITGLELLDDGHLRMEGFDESNRLVQSTGEFLGGGRQVSWSEPDNPPVDSASSPDRNIRKNQPLFFHGEVDLESNAHILVLSWATEGDEQNRPAIRYRTSPDRGAPYSPWSVKVTGSPLEIARQGRYFEYSIEFPKGSPAKVGEVRVHYLFPEKGKAGGGKSDSGLSGNREDEGMLQTAKPSTEDDDSGMNESDIPKTRRPENPLPENQNSSQTIANTQQPSPQDTQLPNPVSAPDQPLTPSPLPEGKGAGSEIPTESEDRSSNESQPEPLSDPGEETGDGEQVAAESDSSISDHTPNANTSPNAGAHSGSMPSSNALTPTLSGGEKEQDGVTEKGTSPSAEESGSGIGGNAEGAGAGSANVSPMSGDCPGAVEQPSLSGGENGEDGVTEKGISPSTQESGSGIGGSAEGTGAGSANVSPMSGYRPGAVKAVDHEQPSLTPTLSQGEREKEQPGQANQPELSEDSGSDAAPGGGSDIGSAEQTASTPANKHKNSSPDTAYRPDPVDGRDTGVDNSEDLSPKIGGHKEGVDPVALGSAPLLCSSIPPPQVVWKKERIPWKPMLLGSGLGWLGLFWLLFLLACRRKRKSYARRLVQVPRDDPPVPDPGMVPECVEKTTTFPKTEETPNKEPLQETSPVYEPTESPAPAVTRPEPSNPSGMTGIAFLRDRAVYILDEKGAIYRSDILGGRFQTLHRVGVTPIHCDDVQLAVGEEAIFFLVPPSQLKGPQLFVAPLDTKGIIGRWQISPLPKSSRTPSPIWVEGGHLLAIIREQEVHSAIYAARIQQDGRLCEWNRVVPLPRGIRPESAAISGNRCLIINRREQSGKFDLLAVALRKSRQVSYLGSFQGIRGRMSLVTAGDRIILLDGGDRPGRAQIYEARTGAETRTVSWHSRNAGFYPMLSSLSGVVVGDRILIAGSRSATAGRHSSMSSYMAYVTLDSLPTGTEACPTIFPSRSGVPACR